MTFLIIENKGTYYPIAGILIVLYLLAGTFSCDKQAVPSEEADTTVEFIPEYEFCQDMMTVDFLNSQNEKIGSVYLSNNDDQLNITFQTQNGWQLGDIHLYAGSLEDLPMNTDGTPRLGNFPFVRFYSTYTDLYTFDIDIDPFEYSFIVAAQAEIFLLDDLGNVIQSDNAWTSGIKISESNTATYVEYYQRECESCYINDSTILYAGQNIPVGYVSFTNDDEFLYVRYHTTDGWNLSSTKLYAGELSGLPVNSAGNPVLGQFPYQQAHDLNVTQYTHTIPLNDLPACYIIASYADVYRIDGGVVISEGAWGYGTEFPEASQWGWYFDYCTQICE